jgi:hypothetical protein
VLALATFQLVSLAGTFVALALAAVLLGLGALAARGRGPRR